MLLMKNLRSCEPIVRPISITNKCNRNERRTGRIKPLHYYQQFQCTDYVSLYSIKISDTCSPCIRFISLAKYHHVVMSFLYIIFFCGQASQLFVVFVSYSYVTVGVAKLFQKSQSHISTWISREYSIRYCNLRQNKT